MKIVHRKMKVVKYCAKCSNMLIKKGFYYCITVTHDLPCNFAYLTLSFDFGMKYDLFFRERESLANKFTKNKSARCLMNEVLNKLALKYWQHLKPFSCFFLAPLHLVHLQYEDSALPLRYSTSVDHVIRMKLKQSPNTIYTQRTRIMDCTSSFFTYHMIVVYRRRENTTERLPFARHYQHNSKSWGHWWCLFW